MKYIAAEIEKLQQNLGEAEAELKVLEKEQKVLLAQIQEMIGDAKDFDEAVSSMKKKIGKMRAELEQQIKDIKKNINE